MFEFRTFFGLNDKAVLDGLEVTVIAITIRGAGAEYEVSWVNNGDHRTCWVPDFRLQEKPVDA